LGSLVGTGEGIQSKARRFEAASDPANAHQDTASASLKGRMTGLGRELRRQVDPR
jgi:hypothetical protein